MKELITIEQMNRLMLLVLVAAPVIGIVCGVIAKRLKTYGLAGLAIGVGNYVLWTVYSAITNKLGLDTVVNLAVNLALFVAVGVVVGIVLGRKASKSNAGD
jgi:hypothetical protein